MNPADRSMPQRMWFDPLNKVATTDPATEFAHDPALIEQCIVFHREDTCAENKAKLREAVHGLLVRKRYGDRRGDVYALALGDGYALALDDVLTLLDAENTARPEESMSTTPWPPTKETLEGWADFARGEDMDQLEAFLRDERLAAALALWEGVGRCRDSARS